MKKIIEHILDDSGQSTVEFAIVTAALLCFVIAIGLLWKGTDNGLLIEHALGAASHHLQEGLLGIVGDFFAC